MLDVKNVESLQFEAVTWNQAHSMLINQSQKIRSGSFNSEIIIGVSRGGWIPARILSDLLENNNLESVGAESYTGIGKAKAQVSLVQNSINVSGKRVLLVDEVADSGRTLKLITEYINSKGATEVKTATMYLKNQCGYKPDFFEKTTDSWVIFPWEIRETITKLRAICTVNQLSEGLIVSRLAEAGVPKRFLLKLSKNFWRE